MRHAMRAAILLTTLQVATTITTAQQLTVETIFGEENFSTKTSSNLVWSDDGSSLYYYAEDANVHGIWRINLKTGERSIFLDSQQVPQLRAEKREKRFSLPNYYFSPDGKDVLLPSDSDLFMYNVATKTIRRLTNDQAEERDPQFSPDGHSIAFLKNHNLHVLDLQSGQSHQLTQQGSENLLIGQFDWVYEEEFSIRTGFLWSPDSRHLAYFCFDQSNVNEFPLIDYVPVHNVYEPMRYPKAGDSNSVVRIGVVSVEATNGHTRWMELGEEADFYIPRIQWLPNGRQLGMLRLNRDQNHLELLIGEVATGRTKLVFEEKAENGWIDINDDWRFLDDGKTLLWLSMRDGWQHIYLYDMPSREMRQVTTGRWEVASVSGVDEKKQIIYFTATEKSHLERHLYHINFDGSRLQRVTKDNGFHDIKMRGNCAFYVDSFSSMTHPPQMTLHQNDGKQLALIDTNNLPALQEYGLREPEFGVMTTEGGESLHYWMLKPPDFDPARQYPVLMYVYGGPGSQTVANRWFGTRGLWHQMMAARGYLIVSVDNRGTGWRGRSFMMQTYKQLGTLETADQIAAAKWLATQPYVDGSRIAIWGWSYGGYMAASCLLRGSEIFKAAISVAPVTDWRNYDTIYTERFMLRPEKNPEGYRQTSLPQFAENLQGRLLLVHGTSDDNVHMSNALQLAYALQNARKPFSLMLYPRKLHGIRGTDTQVHLFNMITSFVTENL